MELPLKKAMGVQSLRNGLETETEFVTLSHRESIEAMSRFTGGDATRVHLTRTSGSGGAADLLYASFCAGGADCE